MMSHLLWDTVQKQQLEKHLEKKKEKASGMYVKEIHLLV